MLSLNNSNMLNRTHIQIFLDLQYKNYTRLMVTEETMASELCKSLKQKYAQAPASTNIHSSQASTGSGTARAITQADFKKGGANIALSKAGKADKETQSILLKEEFNLFLINTKAINPVLFVRKLAPNDYVLRINNKIMENFKRDGAERFKLCFAKQNEIEALIKQKSSYQSQSDEENKVVSQLGRSIINNKTYERKGKLLKKGLNSDEFKERQFVLDKDQLFYYKNEKQKDKNFNLIMLSNANVSLLDNYPKQKYCFQIENENRKYILCTKGKYDLDQWVYAIQGQIKLSRDNKNLSEVNQCIVNKEKEISQHDMALVQKIFKAKNSIFNPVQPILLDFINDPFLNELLPNLTKYMTLVNDKDYQLHAFEKAKEIYQQLQSYQKKAQMSLGSGQDLPNSSALESIDQNQNNEDYKHYKDLRPEQKIQCLFSAEDFKQIEVDYQQIITMMDKSQQQPPQLNKKIFNPILMKIQRILKYNYLDDLYKNRDVELLGVPNMLFKTTYPGLEFNACGTNFKTSGDRQCNIFESLLIKRTVQEIPVKLDPQFQNQLKNFIGNISAENKILKLGNQAIIDGQVQKIMSNYHNEVNYPSPALI